MARALPALWGGRALSSHACFFRFPTFAPVAAKVSNEPKLRDAAQPLIVGFLQDRRTIVAYRWNHIVGGASHDLSLYDSLRGRRLVVARLF